MFIEKNNRNKLAYVQLLPSIPNLAFIVASKKNKEKQIPEIK